MKHFARFLRSELKDRKHCDAAASMGISPSQLSKMLSGNYRPEQDTLRRIIRGISPDRERRALCMAAWLRDQALLAGAAARQIRISVLS